MTTTLQANATARRLNYCTLPTIDVEVLEDQPSLCSKCDKELFYVAGPHTWAIGTWYHADESEEHYVSPRPSCHYCGANDTVKYTQESWYDKYECSRCAGIYGYPIGD